MSFLNRKGASSFASPFASSSAEAEDDKKATGEKKASEDRKSAKKSTDFTGRLVGHQSSPPFGGAT
jgi:hypothetical protein